MKRMGLLLMLAATLGGTGLAQEIDRLEFYETPITEILVALGAATGNAIVPDGSVTGSTSYFVQDTSFESALATFARHHDLFVTREDDIYLVSRLKVVAEDNRFSVEAIRVSSRALLRALFDEAGREVQLLSDRDPTIGPLDFASKNLDEVVALIAAQANMQYEVTAGIYTIWDQADGTPDGRVTTKVVAPKHLSVESVVELLPPQVTTGVAVRRDAASGLLTVSGPTAAVGRVLDTIAAIDRPAPTISYQLLIVEYHEESAFDVESSVGSRLTGPESVQAFVGALGPLLTLNFDVLSAFGYEFALDLAARLESSSAAIVLDTKLHGVAGETVRFESREVQRVWSTSAGGVAPTPVLQEVGAGLETQITGRIGDHNEVIVRVETIVSRFDTEQRDEARGPNTRERVVATTARGRTGTPIVLSAYVEEVSRVRHVGPPLLSRIPIVRRLFGARDEANSTTELGIYLIPRIVGASTRPPLEDELANLIARHLENNDERE